MRAKIEEGTERKDRCYVRVWSDGKWKLKQRYLWEKHRGPIPPRHRICFLDGNPQNLRLSNMILVSEAASLSVGRALGSDRIPALTKVQIALFELQQKVKEAAV